jgi:hypothetical protein
VRACVCVSKYCAVSVLTATNCNRRMVSSRMLCRVALVRADVSEELRTSFIRVTRIGELGTLALTSNRRTLRRNTKLVTASVVPSSPILVTLMKEVLFLQNVGSYKSHTALHPRRHNSS